MTPYRAPPDAPAEPSARDLVALAWRPRTHPRAVTALVAEGTAAAALLRRLLALPDASLVALRGVADPRHVLITGPAPLLPWIDGARYLGRAPDAPTLTLPTAQDPTIPLGLLARRVAPLEPVALWPAPGGGIVVCPLAEARPLDRARILAAQHVLVR